MNRNETQRITWWPLDDTGSSGSLTGSEDYIEGIVGELMNSFYSPSHGWAIAYEIENV